METASTSQVEWGCIESKRILKSAVTLKFPFSKERCKDSVSSMHMPPVFDVEITSDWQYEIKLILKNVLFIIMTAQDETKGGHVT